MKFTILAITLTFSFLAIQPKAIAQSNESFDALRIFEIMGDFPAVGSNDEKLEVAELLLLQNTRTKAQCDYAQSQSTASLENLFGGDKGALTDSEIKNMKKRLRIPLIRAGIDIEITKVHYKRMRPYDVHPEIKPCIDLESSKSYPSGHAALARMYARILSEYFPERKNQLIRLGNAAALNRVIGGVHHPSDIVAGIKLGDYLADGIINDLN